ncbi:MAG: hypothetical protein ACRESZ_03810 [Methylococcales bacterium]
MLRLTKKPSSRQSLPRQGLPEPAEAKESATQTLPCGLDTGNPPAIPAGAGSAGMATWLKHLANYNLLYAGACIEVGLASEI